MYPITAKEVLADSIKKIEVTAPDIAKRAKAGQFVIIRVSSKGERIPLTIADKNEKNGTVSLIFQEIGKTTLALGRLNAGDSIMDIVGPLGHPTESVKHGTVVAIGGGVGAAEILPVSRMYRECGNDVIGIIGARTRDLVILEREMTGSCGRLFVATDDGSAGRKGFVTDVLKELIEKGDKIDLVYAIGPVPMMRAIANLTKPFGIKTVVSLNPIMIDGTGMCGACRVTVGSETKFACVDGPEFDGHQVHWDELIQRLSAFKVNENNATENYKRVCKCDQHA